MIASIAMAVALIAGPERDNHKGVQAWSGNDTAAALKAFAKAARDTTRPDFAFNLGTAKALSGKDGEAELSRAVALSRTADEKARAHYNRGTARLAKALSAPQGQGDPSGAIADLREALKARPGWNEASRNLDRALRMRPPPDPKKDPKDDPKQDPKQDPKKDSPDPKKDDGGQQPRPQPQPGMDSRDAQRLLDGAATREAQQARDHANRKKEDTDAPDW